MGVSTIEKPFSSASLSSAPVSSSFTDLLPKGSSAKMSPRVSLVPGGIFAVGPDAAAIGDRDVGADGLAHGVGDEVADRGLLAAHGGAAAVERRLVVPMAIFSSASSLSW